MRPPHIPRPARGRPCARRSSASCPSSRLVGARVRVRVRVRVSLVGVRVPVRVFRLAEALRVVPAVVVAADAALALHALVPDEVDLDLHVHLTARTRWTRRSGEVRGRYAGDMGEMYRGM